MPLPPYIAWKRPTDAADASDYQTMFAPRRARSPLRPLRSTSPTDVAALDAKGIARETLTLHVGAGTFLPVKVADTGDHRMHAEWGRIDSPPPSASMRLAPRADG